METPSPTTLEVLPDPQRPNSPQSAQEPTWNAALGIALLPNNNVSSKWMGPQTHKALFCVLPKKTLYKNKGACQCQDLAALCDHKSHEYK